MKKFSIHTLGCKVNQYEGEKIKAMLLSVGYKEVNFDEEADIHIINTCSVTTNADSKSRKLIHKAAGLKGEVYVTGCSVENPQSNVNNNGVKVVPNSRKIQFFQNLCQDPSFSLFRKSEKGDCGNLYFRSRPLVQIQDGCTQKCTYCIVPILRGNKSISRPYEDVINEIEKIIKAGYEEIVLTGINIGLYNHNGNRLADLLDEINQIKGNFRIRLSSIEINSFTQRLIRQILSEGSKVTKHLHIPMQSGSNKILKEMKRPYSIENFIDKVECLRKNAPGLSFTTDCIVGFPGENEDDFNETLSAVKKIGFSKVHTFRFSKRPMTQASKLQDDVSPEDKKKRSAKLTKTADLLRKNYLKSQIGQTLEVLCEQYKNGYISGIGGNYVKVKFKGSKELLNKLASVRILKASEDMCQGELIQ